MKNSTPLMLQMIEEGHRTGEISSKITAESFLIFMNMIIEHSKTLGKAFQKNRKFTEEMLHILLWLVRQTVVINLTSLSFL